MNNNIFVSIVIPVFNSAESLDELFQRIDLTLKDLYNYQLILVDDGSTDNSWEIIEDLKKKHSEKIFAIKFAKNFGQHNAILCGFKYCSGDIVITMDDDLQHPPEEIPKLLLKYEETDADIVYGIPLNKQHTSTRKAASYVVSSSSEHSTKDVKQGSSFRLIKREIVTELTNNYYYNFLYLDAVLNWYTGQIATVTVEHHPRKNGKSGYTILKLISIYFNILVNYSAGPLKSMTYIGLTISVFSFFAGTYFIWKKITHNVPLGYTSIIVSVLFSTGLILCCLGIVLQYLYKLYMIQNKRPLYFIQKQLK